MKHKAGVCLVAIAFGLSGCVGTIIDATTDAAIEVVKIPFKIGGAAVDLMKGEDPDKVNTDDDEDDTRQSPPADT